MLLPLGTGPGDVFGPVNVVIGFFAAETSARAFASVSFGAALLWVAPPAGIAVRETTASTSPATAVSGRNLERPRPAFRSYMRPPRVMGPAPGPRSWGRWYERMDLNRLPGPGQRRWSRRERRVIHCAPDRVCTKMWSQPQVRKGRTEMVTAINRQLIDGQWQDGSSGSVLTDRNPYDGSVIAEFPVATPDDIDAAYRAAGRAKEEWDRINPYAKRTVFENA